MYVKDNLKPKVKELKLPQTSCLQVDVLNNSILCIYRSPSVPNADCFINSLSSYIENLSTNNNVIIAGDININIRPKFPESTYEYNNKINYLNMLSSFGIHAGHTFATRKKTCLDHFMLKLINNEKAFIAIIHTSITDHFTTFLSISKFHKKQKAVKSQTKLNYENALKDLQLKNLSELLLKIDPNEVADALINKIHSAIQNNTTIVTIPKSKRIIKPWITTGILRCIKNRNKMQKQTKNDPHNDVLKITYCRYRNYCNNLIKKLKRKHDRETLAKSVNDNRKLWQNIKKITYTNKNKNTDTDLINKCLSPKDSANLVNNYFANIGKNLAQNIKSLTDNATEKLLDDLPKMANSFVLLDADNCEVDDVLKNLKSNSAPGWDNIPIKFLKYARYEIVPILTYLANLCFQKGIFPTALKASIITPIFKGGESDDVSNYRPISVLPAISKIIEKLLNVRLLNYLSKFNILSPSQYGFQRGKSTEDAITDLSTLVTEQLDAGYRCLGVFLDLKKAFDTVSFSILEKKLESIGIRDTPLMLLKNYLLDRKQKVKLGNCISDDVQVSYGVPQGSVLGPTLFLIYINDLCNMKIKGAKVFSYADDTAVVFTGKSWDNIKIDAEIGLKSIGKWLKNNLLSLNASKSNYMCFSINNRRQPDSDFNIRIHDCESSSTPNCNCPKLEKVSQIKYLGVILDDKLSWHPHLDQVACRVRKLSWIFRALRHIAPPKSPELKNNDLLTTIYLALVQSVLVYCIPVWGGAGKTKFLDLERAQRGLLKIMYFKKRTFPTSMLYKLCNRLSVRKLYILQIVLKKHKNIDFDAKILTKRRKYNLATIPRTKTTFAIAQFPTRSAYLYNKLDKELDIYNKPFHECKKTIINWLQPLNFEDTEYLLNRIQ